MKIELLEERNSIRDVPMDDAFHRVVELRSKGKHDEADIWAAEIARREDRRRKKE